MARKAEQMKIQTTIRTPKGMSKVYLENLFKDVADYAKTLPQYKDAVRAHFGKEDLRGGFNISFYEEQGRGMTHFKTFESSKELVAFCEGVRVVHRGW